VFTKSVFQHRRAFKCFNRNDLRAVIVFQTVAIESRTVSNT
jgi:hypothetical protein